MHIPLFQLKSVRKLFYEFFCDKLNFLKIQSWKFSVDDIILRSCRNMW